MSGSIKKDKKYIVLFLVAVVVLVVGLSSISTVLKIIYPVKYKEHVLKYSKIYNVDPYLVFSMIKAESNFDANALSHRNARGLMQITESTGKWIAQKLEVDEFNVDDLYEPEMNIRFGCWYINYLFDKEFKDTEMSEDKLNLIIMSYNGGSRNVKDWVKKNGSSDLTYEQIPFKETRNYLKKVKDYKTMYKKLYEKII